MLSFMIFIWSVSIIPFSICSPAGLTYFTLDDNVVYTVEGTDNHTACSLQQSQQWSYDFHNCFIDRKYADGGRDLNNIVDRILDHSADCIGNGTKQCRPGYSGFHVIMSKVIEQIQDYSKLYLDAIYHGRENIKDLDCVEKSLSDQSYADCFKPVFKLYSTEDNFLEKVEKAISCTNKSNRLCSKQAKASINRMVRYILKVKGPKVENFEDDEPPTTRAPPPPPPPTPAPKRWYDYIFQPFISAWNTIKSWFGF